MRLAVLALALVSACTLLQSAGTVLLIHWLARRRATLESPKLYRRAGMLLRIFLWIVVIHLIQVSVWAAGFWSTGALPDLETATYFSLVTFTTIGYGDVVLPPPWRLLAGVEGLSGILLIGWSTALMFTVVNRMYERWRQVHEDER